MVAEQRKVLLTVSGEIPAGLDDDVEAGRRPRADYRVLAEVLAADIVDVAGARAATGRIGAVVNRIGGAGALLAWYAFRNRGRYRVIVSDGEQVGLPLALLFRLMGRRAAHHVMIVHVMSTKTKTLMMRLAHLAPMVDRYLVYASRQRRVLVELGVAADRIALTPFMVDTRFFAPSQVDEPRAPMICSAGLERRDYATLIRAVDGLDVEVVIAAASPWSRQADASKGLPLPANVRIERLSLFDLRSLYAASRFVVMPLVDVDFQAGITTILEAMAMGRGVLCTRTEGQTDTIRDGETGRYVPAGDPDALRAAIVAWLDDQEETDRIGERARNWVVAHAEVDRYAENVAAVVRSLPTSSR